MGLKLGGGGGGGISQADGDARYLKLAGGTMTGAIVSAAGTVAAPAIGIGAADTGFYRSAADISNFTSSGSRVLVMTSSLTGMASGHQFGWYSNAFGQFDTVLSRDAANTLALKNANADQMFRSYGMNGGYWERGSVSELLTLSTVGATTDTTANLLPANSIIEAVVARITTTITTATNWSLGDATTAGRFAAANATMVAGTTTVGLVHVDVVGAAGKRQTAAAKLRVTTTGTPGAGVIRLVVFYRTFVPPTS